MDKPLKSDGIPARQLINQALLEKTAAQIQKDLRIDALGVSAGSDANPFEQLYNALLPIVEGLLAKRAAELPQLFYQVDLGEKQVAEAISGDNPAPLLTEAIIRRCFQKVVLREMYRNAAKD